MSRRRNWLVAGFFLLGCTGASAPSDDYPPSTILLFVASWCAPCHAELARLPAITRGAQPFRVLVVPFDDRPATLRMLDSVAPGQRWQPDRLMRRRLAKALTAATSGLPFSMAIDGSGQQCGSERKGLDGASAKALVAGCAQ